jgi:hypothetical protein
MTNLLLATLFGLCTIATAFVFFGWIKVLRQGDGYDRKYFITALGITVANLGVMVLCANRTSAFMGWGEFFPVMLLVPALIILTGKTLWLYGAALGHTKWLIHTYAVTCVIWVLYMLWRYL